MSRKQYAIAPVLLVMEVDPYRMGDLGIAFINAISNMEDRKIVDYALFDLDGDGSKSEDRTCLLLNPEKWLRDLWAEGKMVSNQRVNELYAVARAKNALEQK